MHCRTVATCASLIMFLSLATPPHLAHAAVHSCALIKVVRTNLNQLQALASATPRLSAKQATQKTDEIKFREVSLELGNARRTVPKNVDDSIARVVSSIRHAVDLHARHQNRQYRAVLPLIRSEMKTAWDRFYRFQRGKHC